MLIDTHAHIDDEKYSQNLDELIKTSKQWGLEHIIIPSVGPDSWEKVFNLVQKNNFFYGAIGIHPEELEKFSDDLKDKFIKYAKQDKILAIGEIGLDYYFDKSNAEKQKIIFEKQIEWAKIVHKPLLIHDREAHKDTFDILEKTDAKQIGAVLHCFSGSLEFANECIKKGFYIAVGGVVTFKNAQKLKEVAKNIDINYLLLETDCPYLTPAPHRGELNQPYYVKFVADEIAELRGISKEELYEITTQNAKRFLNIK